jgi:hypothetical protein
MIEVVKSKVGSNHVVLSIFHALSTLSIICLFSTKAGLVPVKVDGIFNKNPATSVCSDEVERKREHQESKLHATSHKLHTKKNFDSCL